MLLHGAAPCSGFQLTHTRPDMQQQVDVTHTAVALPDLRRQGDTDGEAAASQPHRQTWLVRLKDPGSISLWLGSADAAKQAVSGIVQVCLLTGFAVHVFVLRRLCTLLGQSLLLLITNTPERRTLLWPGRDEWSQHSNTDDVP